MAKGKVIQRVFELKDKFTPTLKNVQKGTLQFKKDVSDLKTAGTKAFKGLAVGVAAGVAAVGVATLAVGKVMKDSIKEANEMIAAETKLAQVMRNTMEATNSQIESVKALANAQQGIGVISSGVQLAGAQELGTYLTEAKSLETLLPTLNDMLAQQYGLDATAESAVNIGTMIGKVMDGQLGALSRYGYSWTEAQEHVLTFGTEAQRAATLVDVIGQSVGGMNEALAQTPEGKMKQLKFTIAGIREELGRKIAIPMYNWGIQWLIDKIPVARKIAVDTFESIKNSVEKNKEKFDQIKSTLIGIKKQLFGAFSPDGEGGGALYWFINTGIPLTVGGIASILNGASKTYNYIRDNWSLIAPIVYGIVGALAAYYTMTKSIIIAKYALTAATLAWRTALKMTPIGWITTGISLLITAGVFLMKNWDDVKLAGQKLWNQIINDVEWGANAYINIVNHLNEQIISGFNWLIEQLNSLPGVKIGEITYTQRQKVDFGSAKFDTEGKEFQWGKKKEEKSFEDILAEYDKQQEFNVERQQASNDRLISSLDDNTDTMKSTAGRINDINVTLYASDLTAEEVADILVPKIKRKLFA